MSHRQHITLSLFLYVTIKYFIAIFSFTFPLSFFCCWCFLFILRCFIRCRCSIIAPVSLLWFSFNYLVASFRWVFRFRRFFFSLFPRLSNKLNGHFSYLGCIYLVFPLELMLLLCIILRCIPRQTQSDISANIVSNISCESGLCYNNHIIVI